MDNILRASETSNQVVRVLIVSASEAMRRLIRLGVETDPRISVVAQAENAIDARDCVERHAPHVIMLDADMPGMTGPQFMGWLMKAGPMPGIMLVSMTGDGRGIALRAPGSGAVDVVAIHLARRSGHGPFHLPESILLAARSQARDMPLTLRPEPTGHAKGRAWNDMWIMIGASTGGVEAVETLLRGFPADCPPTLITQHMPPNFLRSFATRLNAIVEPEVEIARDGVRPKPGEVFVAPGGETHLVLDPAQRVLRLWRGPKVSGYRPSVDAMFDSAVPYAAKTIAIILTGMGQDGARAMKALRDAGAICIGQDRESSVIYGMPRMAAELGATQIELPLEQIAPHALAAAQAKRTVVDNGR
jgi:two-component system, chemotaxis family, protein-glutamate methylesterase/glutaminase